MIQRVVQILQAIWDEAGPRAGDEDQCAVPDCEARIEYVAPDYLCRLHWCEWWADGMDAETEEEYEELLEEALENAAERELIDED